MAPIMDKMFKKRALISTIGFNNFVIKDLIEERQVVGHLLSDEIKSHKKKTHKSICVK